MRPGCPFGAAGFPVGSGQDRAVASGQDGGVDTQRAVVAVDRDGLVTWWDAGAVRFFGRTADEILGHDVAFLVPAELRGAHHRGFGAVMAGGPTRLEGLGAHLPVLGADGVVRTFPARFTVLRDAAAVPVGAVAVYGPPAGAAPFTPVEPAASAHEPEPERESGRESGRGAVRRVVACLPGGPADAALWTRLLGLEPVFHLGWVIALQAGHAQVQLVTRDATAPEDAHVSVEVDTPATLAAVHAEALRAGLEIVHPTTDEPWGVRRFFVRFPGGAVVNVLTHVPQG